MGWSLMVAAGSLLLAAAPAAAHATVESSEPADGSHLDHGPAQIAVHLDEPVTLVAGSAQLLDDAGERHALAATRYADGQRTVVLVPRGTLPDGAYLATARVVSADTHVVSLSVQLTVGAVSTPARLAAGAGSDDGVAGGVASGLGGASKAAAYLGLVLSSGVFLATRWAWPRAHEVPRYRPVYRVGAGVLVVGLVGRAVQVGAERAGGLDALTWGTAGQVARTGHGTAVGVAVAATLVTLVVVPGRGAAGAALGGVQAAAAVTAVTLGGHGGSSQRWPWSFAETFVHVYAAAVWLGGVAVLALVVRDVGSVRRWHRVAAGHVALVVGAGVLLAFAQVSPPAALVTTAYGRVLLVKVALVAAALALGLAAYRAYRRGSTSRGRPGAVVAEAGLAVAALVATSVLTSLVPARDAYTADVAATLDFGDAQVVHVRVDTVRRGPQTITVSYRASAAGTEPGADPGVQVDLASVEADVARLPVRVGAPVRDGGELTWRSDGLVVPVRGRWQVTVRFDGSQGPRLASFSYEVL